MTNKRYFYHDESDTLFTEGKEVGIEAALHLGCIELTKAEYRERKKRELRSRKKGIKKV